MRLGWPASSYARLPLDASLYSHSAVGEAWLVTSERRGRKSGPQAFRFPLQPFCSRRGLAVRASGFFVAAEALQGASQ